MQCHYIYYVFVFRAFIRFILAATKQSRTSIPAGDSIIAIRILSREASFRAFWKKIIFPLRHSSVCTVTCFYICTCSDMKMETRWMHKGWKAFPLICRYSARRKHSVLSQSWHTLSFGMFRTCSASCTLILGKAAKATKKQGSYITM